MWYSKTKSKTKQRKQQPKSASEKYNIITYDSKLKRKMTRRKGDERRKGRQYVQKKRVEEEVNEIQEK